MASGSKTRSRVEWNKYENTVPRSVMIVHLEPGHLYAESGIRNAKKSTPAKRKAVKLMLFLG